MQSSQTALLTARIEKQHSDQPNSEETVPCVHFDTLNSACDLTITAFQKTILQVLSRMRPPQMQHHDHRTSTRISVLMRVPAHTNTQRADATSLLLNLTVAQVDASSVPVMHSGITPNMFTTTCTLVALHDIVHHCGCVPITQK